MSEPFDTDNEQDRLDALLALADYSGLSLDLLWALSRGMEANAFRIFSGNCANLPRYMKSIVTENFYINGPSGTNTEPSSQFRHQGKVSNVAFLDGHVEAVMEQDVAPPSHWPQDAVDLKKNNCFLSINI